jgi:hypothetical protein
MLNRRSYIVKLGLGLLITVTFLGLREAFAQCLKTEAFVQCESLFPQCGCTPCGNRENNVATPTMCVNQTNGQGKTLCKTDLFPTLCLIVLECEVTTAVCPTNPAKDQCANTATVVDTETVLGETTEGDSCEVSP